MTLILTAIHRHGVIQVADRLVTRQTNGHVEQFDPLANKTILFSARDAFVTLAYTGLAYIDGLPTDRWIAETLRDRPVALGHDGRRPVALSFERVANWPSVGQAVLRLAGRVDMAMSRLSQAARLSIVVAGWQQYRTKRPRAIGLTIDRPLGRLTQVLRLRRHLGRGFGLITAPDGHLSDEDQRLVLDRVRQVTPVDAELAWIPTERVSANAPPGNPGRVWQLPGHEISLRLY